jgi:hypothetical protein
MNILFAGDSWTFGEELQDKTNTRFSKLVCDALNATEYNISNSGISNDEICLRTTLFLNKKIHIDFTVVQFTYLRRMTIPNENKGMFRRKYITLSPNSLNYFDKQFYRYYVNRSSLNHNAWYDLSKYKMILLHNYLNSMNIKHMFMFTKNIDFADFVTNDLDLPPSLKQVCHLEGLFNVCETNNFPIGVGYHGLEEAHKYYAEQIILPRIMPT